MEKRKGKEELVEDSKEIQLLKEYLSQYVECVEYKRDLEKRLKRIEEEMDSPIGGVGYSPIPTNTNSVGAGAASFTIKKAEIQERILEQKEKIAVTLINVMDILDYLPEGSREKKLLEYRYLDNIPWRIIYKKMNLTRTPCFNATNKAYRMLIGYKRVQNVLKEYEKEMENK